MPRAAKWFVTICFLLICCSVVLSALATEIVAHEPPALAEVESAVSQAERLDALEAESAEARLAGHNAWMLVCCALVLFMTAPGLAMFYGGLVRKRNVLSVLMQCFFLMGLMTVVWALFGYSLAFGGDNPWLGNGEFLFMSDVARTWDPTNKVVIEPMEGSIPRITHMLFQGMFFIITPALICGAFAERMKFSSMTVLLLLWNLLVYCPLCHWVWDGGILAYGKEHAFAGGVLDFAGGIVVHVSSGVSALLIAILLGKRLGFGNEPMPPHNVTYTVLGAAMLWVGWFGFNAGSELASDHLTSSVFAVTHFSAAAGILGWITVEWIIHRKPTVLGAATGAIAGLACITPAAGFVNLMPAIFIGFSAGVICFFACTTLKNKFQYDDSLDVFGVHGVGGMLGVMMAGVFGTRACWDVNNGLGVGLIEGNYQTIVGQFVAIVITVVYSLVLTFVLYKIVDRIMGMRVDNDTEMRGLDLSEHGEEGYIWL